MITTRARGLANLHAAAITLVIGVFFIGYAHAIYHVPFVHLNRSVNLLPYLACVLVGMLLSTREVSRLTTRLHVSTWTRAVALATRQVGVVALLVFAMMFATQDTSMSRLFLGSFLVWSWLLLILLNAQVPRWLARLVFQKGHRLPTLFIGSPASLSSLHDWLADKEALGIDPVGMLSPEGATINGSGAVVARLGRVDELPRVLQEQQVGQVVMLEFPGTDAEARVIIEQCEEHGCRLLIQNTIEKRYTHPLVPITEEGRHFYTLQEEPLEDPFNRLLKRSLDVAIAMPVVLVLFPCLCAVVWLVQRFQSPGALFHIRERRGMRGSTFAMLKFRSMHEGTGKASDESLQARADDARIYPFGRFLRRRSLDEIPQFWNVLRGEMSVVGPRPYMPMLDEEFRQKTKAYRTRHLVKPGITGLAQSLGYRGEILEREMLNRRHHWDVYYITHWSLWLDLRITLRTAWQVIFPPKTAY